ncbi:hypothetical protein AAVH_23432 [Aphelenchoides avenae]|nr:hypothetical protein AAVH_23432 [Aphelenchus avenae]
MPPITDTDDGSETDDRDVDVEPSEDVLSALPTDETYAVWRQTPPSHANHPEETDRLCRLEDTFDMLDELAAKTMSIVAGAARYGDGIPSASSSSPETAPSEEDSRCLLKYVQTLEKMEANYTAARSLVEGVINKHRPSV